MDKKVMGLLGAVSTLAMAGAAQASVPVAADMTPLLQAQSFADLLAPIPNAAATLQALDAASPPPEAGVQLAQYDGGYGYHHHHHHHHHSYYRPHYQPHYKPRYQPHYHHHHHHHHHYNSRSYGGGGGYNNNEGY